MLNSIMFNCFNVILFTCLLFMLPFVRSVSLVIKIPEGLSSDNSTYRLDYFPPYGLPLPNTTFSANLIKDSIEFSQALPGTKYEFYLYYTNSTLHNWLSWAASITTTPDPPANLSVHLKTGKVVQIRWSPPAVGQYSGFRLKLTSLSEKSPARIIDLAHDSSPYTLRDLTPGGSYQVQLFSVFDSKESVAYTSRNFTTKPNSPGKFIVWFRNETTLLVLWHPSYPLSIYSHYKVSIDPPDAPESVLYIEKEGVPPGPAQAAFKQLSPGRAYNISVQTVSEDEISSPTYAEYRTLPSKPSYVTYEKSSLSTDRMKILWEPPKDSSEFDKYQISINVSSLPGPILKSRDEPRVCEITDGLEPGRSYEVIVKSVSGKVASLPVAVNITLKPLPVRNLKAWFDLKTNDLTLSWRPDNGSYQTSFRILYFEVEEALNGDSNQISVEGATTYVLRSLLPGRNYSITVQAISNGMESNGTSIYQLTRPSSPLIEDLSSFEFGLNIAWKSDINSRQHHFEVIYNRNDSSGIKVPTVIETIESKVSINDLYPGARFRIQVVALNHGLRSDTHDFYYQAVRPKPPTNLKMEILYLGAIGLHWDEPMGTEFTEYVVRFRTADEDKWSQLPESGRTPAADLIDLVPGTKYFLQVNSLSYSVESTHPLDTNYTTPPSPVNQIDVIAGSSNITLKFPRPDGRIEFYEVKWGAVRNKSRSEDDDTKHSAKYYDNRDERVEVLIDKLSTGTKYAISIRTVSNGLKSNITFVSAHTLPVIETQVIIVHDQEHTDSITLRYTPQKSHFDFYRFSISDPKVPVVEKAANDTNRKVTFSSLSPGKLYNVTIWAVADDVLSVPLVKRDRLYPQTVTQINGTEITKNTIKLVWNKPHGEYNYFKVEYFTPETLLVQKFTLQTSITLEDLKPYQNYTVTISVVAGSEASILRESLPLSTIIQTLESTPGKPDTFRPTEIQPRYIVFLWSLPKDEHNGVLTKFTISYVQEDFQYVYSQDFSPEEHSGTIKGLIPGKTYIFKLQAETKIGPGPEITYKYRMPILAPPRPGVHNVPVEVYHTSTTIQIRFRKNYFSDENGAVVSYTIIAAEDFKKNSSGLEMLSWRDVQHYSIWPPYQVLEPFQVFQNTSDFTIGEDVCDNKHGHCNGPLKPGSTYKVKIRAFTAPDKFADTAYSFPITTERDSTPFIVSSIICIILVLVASLFGLVFLYRRRNAPLSNKTPTFVLHNVKSRPVRLSNFANHYEIMSADSEFYFSEEFDELKNVGSSQPCSAANLACNRPKNRFTNILPYDHSRVKLQPVDDEEGSDYINANYVPGYNSPREFIATQGPLRSTRDDFWRMCWESNSPAIVMLTRCVEKGREKCDHYWPSDRFPEYNGDICVTVVDESHYPDWSITKMVLCRGNHQRMIRHFHFTTWPDFGVPDPPQIVTAFVRAFRELVRPNQKPIIVHCSAGVGRSGTFIALDRILQSLGHADTVDVFGVVYQMRRERTSMVQSEQQYVCIHQCLLAVLQGQEAHQQVPEVRHGGASDDDDEGIAESEI